jgi:hydrogenase expression/formation protein HypE
MNDNKILIDHGSGGLLTGKLIEEKFRPYFDNPLLSQMEDSTAFDINGTRLCFTTDSYVINPIFFPGGDIGSLSVHGTVNDIAMRGGKPLYLSAGFIIQEGFEMSELEQIISSMARAAKNAGVQIITGDTKVVDKNSADKIFINTSALGIIEYKKNISAMEIKPGDAVIINGTIGDHATAILNKRKDLNLSSDIISDSAPLNKLVEKILTECNEIHCMRDATRGGLGGILAEIASQSGHTLNIDEVNIPIDEKVRGACEILGFDPLFFANEGKMVLFCPSNQAQTVLHIMKDNPLGKNAAIIGEVSEEKKGRLILKTVIGGKRQVDLPAGELLPRIC